MNTSVVPLKRHSDTAFGDRPPDVRVKDEDFDSPLPAKKARYEDALPKSPLATNRTTLNTAPALIAPASTADVDELREKYRDILADISRIEPIYDRAVRKKNKTKGEETRVATYRNQLNQLKESRDSVKAQIASLTSRPTVRAEPSLAGTQFSFNCPSDFALGSHITHLLAMPKQEPRPDLVLALQAGSSRHLQAAGASRLPYAQAAASGLAPWTAHVQRHQEQNPPPTLTTEQKALLAARQEMHRVQRMLEPPQFPMKVEPNNPLVHPVVKREQANAVASGSGLNRIPPGPVILKSEPRHFGLVKREAVEQRNSLIASSSRTPIVSARGSTTANTSQHTPISALLNSKFESSDDDSDDSDASGPMSYEQFLEGGEALARQLLDDAGVPVPGPMRDVRDEDGLFFGRGRDLYEGPHARTGEYVLPPMTIYVHFLITPFFP